MQTKVEKNSASIRGLVQYLWPYACRLAKKSPTKLSGAIALVISVAIQLHKKPDRSGGTKATSEAYDWIIKGSTAESPPRREKKGENAKPNNPPRAHPAPKHSQKKKHFRSLSPGGFVGGRGQVAPWAPVAPVGPEPVGRRRRAAENVGHSLHDAGALAGRLRAAPGGGRRRRGGRAQAEAIDALCEFGAGPLDDALRWDGHITRRAASFSLGAQQNTQRTLANGLLPLLDKNGERLERVLCRAHAWSARRCHRTLATPAAGVLQGDRCAERKTYACRLLLAWFAPRAPQINTPTPPRFPNFPIAPQMMGQPACFKRLSSDSLSISVAALICFASAGIMRRALLISDFGHIFALADVTAPFSDVR